MDTIKLPRQSEKTTLKSILAIKLHDGKPISEYLDEEDIRVENEGQFYFKRDADTTVPVNIPTNKELLQKIAVAVFQPETKFKLKMDDWHTCKTTHCIAGFAEVMHPDGRAIKNVLFRHRVSPVAYVGELLLGSKAANYFDADDQLGLQFLAQFLPEDWPHPLPTGIDRSGVE
jgi:hypothetical protein